MHYLDSLLDRIMAKQPHPSALERSASQAKEPKPSASLDAEEPRSESDSQRTISPNPNTTALAKSTPNGSALTPIEGGTLALCDLERLSRPVRFEHALAAVSKAAALHGTGMDEDRIETLAEALADPAEDWTVTELEAAAREVGRSPEVRDAIRFGRTISLADFEAARSDERGEAGRRIAKQRLFSHASALARWQRAGEPGGNILAMFELVAKDENGKARFRLI